MSSRYFIPAILVISMIDVPMFHGQIQFEPDPLGQVHTAMSAPRASEPEHPLASEGQGIEGIIEAFEAGIVPDIQLYAGILAVQGSQPERVGPLGSPRIPEVADILDPPLRVLGLPEAIAKRNDFGDHD
jgi:hypothetical protein